MTDSKKLDFYLRHRDLIEEWAAIRDQAAMELDLALESATSLLVEEDLPGMSFTKKYGGRGVRIPVSSGVEVLLWWRKEQLFRAKGERRLPILTVHTPSGRKFAGRAKLKEATRQTRLSHGMTKEGVQWVWKGNIYPEEPLLDLEAYAQTCVVRLRDAWQELHEPIRQALTEAADSADVTGQGPGLDADGDVYTPSAAAVDLPTSR